jgi:hypothetical protein
MVRGTWRTSRNIRRKRRDGPRTIRRSPTRPVPRSVLSLDQAPEMLELLRLNNLLPPDPSSPIPYWEMVNDQSPGPWQPVSVSTPVIVSVHYAMEAYLPGDLFPLFFFIQPRIRFQSSSSK